MTLIPERTNLGNHAYQLIKTYRHAIGDHFRVESLEVEFPYSYQELARKFGTRGLYLARADDNEAGTFKVRGALVGAKALQDSGTQEMRLASAGNHARGAVVAARELGFDRLHVGVPETAPFQKKEGLYNLWDRSHLQIYPVGTAYDETMQWMAQHPEYGPLLHAYDDPHVIAGQGTIADDILAELPEVNVVVVPAGGNGLLAGVRKRLDELDRSDVMVYGAEAEGSNSGSLSQKAGQVVEATAPNHNYSGVQVQRIGQHAFKACQAATGIVSYITPAEDSVEETMALYQQSRVDMWRLGTPGYEPTSLLAIAALAEITKRHPEAVITVVGTGHNTPLPHYV